MPNVIKGKEVNHHIIVIPAKAGKSIIRERKKPIKVCTNVIPSMARNL
jgi:hypothetical protein